MYRIIVLIAVICALTVLFTNFASAETTGEQKGAGWTMGFAYREIAVPENSGSPLYISGYNQGWEIEGIHDLQRANAVWFDVGDKGVLIIGIDCVGLAIDTVDAIRNELKPWAESVDCASINVFATHTHAGLDTLGLWGPIGKDGKNPEFMANLKAAAVEAAKSAYENRKTGKLYYSYKDTGDLQYDSRLPHVYDRNIYQLRFAPDDGGDGIRILDYAAHAESMRGSNKLLSRDYPGVLTDIIKDETGDDVLFMPGAVGGLLMTRELTSGIFDAVKNLELTGRRLADDVLSIEEETEIAPEFEVTRIEFEVPLDNTVYLLYKTIGILNNPCHKGEGETGFSLTSTLSVMRIGDILFGMLPCEIFPELVYGDYLKDTDPEPLIEIANNKGFDKLIIVGLCNDELGYIVTPSDFVLNENAPYIKPLDVQGKENHYEETNSTGRNTAFVIAEAFRTALGELVK